MFGMSKLSVYRLVILEVPFVFVFLEETWGILCVELFDLIKFFFCVVFCNEFCLSTNDKKKTQDEWNYLKKIKCD